MADSMVTDVALFSFYIISAVYIMKVLERVVAKVKVTCLCSHTLRELESLVILLGTIKDINALSNTMSHCGPLKITCLVIELHEKSLLVFVPKGLW